MQIILDGDLQSIDFTKWDDINVIADLYRDVKADAYVILKGLLDENQLGFVKIVQEGSFEPSMLRDENGNWRPVIILSRTNDTGVREGVGEVCQFLINDGSGNMVDVSTLKLPEGAEVLFLTQASVVLLHIDIAAINSQLADQLYGFIKIAMFAAEKKYFMESLGYLDIRRIDGGDGQDIFIEDSGGTHTISNRTLTYTCKTLDFLAGVPRLVDLIKNTYTGQQVQPSGTAAQTTEIN